jgi:hypothetical protein
MDAIFGFFTSTAFLISIIAFIITAVIWYLSRKGILNNTVFGLTKQIFAFVSGLIPNDTEDTKWKITDEVLKRIVVEMNEEDGLLNAESITDLIKRYVKQEIDKAKTKADK